MRQIASRLVLAAALASAGVVACEDSDDDTTTGTDNVGGSGRDGGTGGTGSGDDADITENDAGEEDADGGVSSNIDGGASEGTSGNDAGSADAGDAASQVDLTDPQIGAVTTAANNGEVAQANAALPKLTGTDARAFAQEMIMAHTAAQTRQAALLQSKGITPAENALSTQLQQESNAIVSQLTAAMQDVDRLYVQTQVDVHTKVLETLEDVLIPSAEDADLESELKATRDEVQTHLEHAQELLDALGGA